MLMFKILPVSSTIQSESMVQDSVKLENQGKILKIYKIFTSSFRYSLCEFLIFNGSHNELRLTNNK
jgi:hypothetical protein